MLFILNIMQIWNLYDFALVKAFYVSVCSRRNQNDVASSTKKAPNNLQSSLGSEVGKLWKYFQFFSANFLPYYWILLRHYMQKTLITQFHLLNYNVFPEYLIKIISEFSFSKIQVSPMYQLFIPINSWLCDWVHGPWYSPILLLFFSPLFLSFFLFTC